MKKVFAVAALSVCGFAQADSRAVYDEVEPTIAMAHLYALQCEQDLYSGELKRCVKFVRYASERLPGLIETWQKFDPKNPAGVTHSDLLELNSRVDKINRVMMLCKEYLEAEKANL